TLPERLKAADALVERLRADGPSFLNEAQRAEIAVALYEVAAPITSAFHTLWQQTYDELAEAKRKALETAGKTIDWVVLRSEARRDQELPQYAQETNGLQEQAALIAEGLGRLDSPGSLGLLEQMMPSARNTGTLV